MYVEHCHAGSWQQVASKSCVLLYADGSYGYGRSLKPSTSNDRYRVRARYTPPSMGARTGSTWTGWTYLTVRPGHPSQAGNRRSLRRRRNAKGPGRTRGLCCRCYAALERAAGVPWSGSCATSDQEISSSPKSGAWKGLIVGGGDTAVERRGCPSTAENSDVESMRGLPFVTGP